MDTFGTLFQTIGLVLASIILINSIIGTGIIWQCQWNWISFIFNFCLFLNSLILYFDYDIEMESRRFTATIFYSFTFGIANFVLLLIYAIDYGNKYNESDPETAEFKSWFYFMMKFETNIFF